MKARKQDKINKGVYLDIKEMEKFKMLEGYEKYAPAYD